MATSKIRKTNRIIVIAQNPSFSVAALSWTTIALTPPTSQAPANASLIAITASTPRSSGCDCCVEETNGSYGVHIKNNYNAAATGSMLVRWIYAV